MSDAEFDTRTHLVEGEKGRLSSDLQACTMVGRCHPAQINVV